MRNIAINTIVILFLFLTNANADMKERSYYLFTELGTSFGGEKIAKNDNNGQGGDDYNAGGGGILGVGAIINVQDNYLYSARTFIGYRYQGGDGHNSGVIIEGSLFYRISSQLSVGFGLHSDFSNEIKTQEDKVIKFDNAIGSMIIAEWHTSPQIGLGAKYILIDYKTDTHSYDGNQGVIYVQYRF